MSGTGNEADGADFSRRLEALKPVSCEPTLTDTDKYEPSAREAALAHVVRDKDCVVALASLEMRRLLSVGAIREKMSSLTVILGMRISEDRELVDFLKLFDFGEVSVVTAAAHMPTDTNYCICLIEPAVMQACLGSGTLDRHEIGTLIFLDFEHYLNPTHVYRDIIGLYHNAEGMRHPTSTRLLAFTKDLQVSSLENLESALVTLKTPLRLTCYLGTPVRPFTKDIEERIHRVDLPDQVAASLQEQGRQAGSSLEAEQILAHTPEVLSGLKSKVPNFVRGRTLALTSSVALQRQMKEWLQEASATVIEEPHDGDKQPKVVHVATTADIPTLRKYWWDTVVLCDLPFGVSCNRLLYRAHRIVALATEHEWKRWNEALAFHDDLDRLLRRVNKRRRP